MEKNENLITPYEFAKRCGRTNQAIYAKIKKGEIKTVKGFIREPYFRETNMIDITAFDPEETKFRAKNRKKK